VVLTRSFPQTQNVKSHSPRKPQFSPDLSHRVHLFMSTMQGPLLQLTAAENLGDYCNEIKATMVGLMGSTSATVAFSNTDRVWTSSSCRLCLGEVVPEPVWMQQWRKDTSSSQDTLKTMMVSDCIAFCVICEENWGMCSFWRMAAERGRCPVVKRYSV
jgi:hypothetical protein